MSRHRRLRRDVLDEQNRQPFRRHLVHRPERDAVAVREGQMLVDPRAVRKALGIQLARRQHHLTQFAVDRVAVVVDRREVVVRAQLLNLAERLEQRLVIPEPHVLDGVGVAVDVLARQLGIAGEIARPHRGEIEGLPCRRDVVRHVRRFGRLFVRRDDEALNGCGVERSANRRERDRGQWRAAPATRRTKTRDTPRGRRTARRPPSARAAAGIRAMTSVYDAPGTMPGPATSVRR